MKNLDKKRGYRSSKGSQKVKSMINLPGQDSNPGGFQESLALDDTANGFLRQSQHSYGGDSFRSSPQTDRPLKGKKYASKFSKY